MAAYLHKNKKTQGSSRPRKKTVEVVNSGTIGRGNSNLVTEFIMRLRFSLNCHKSAQNVVRYQRSRRVASMLHLKPELLCHHKTRNYSDNLVCVF